MNKALGDFLRSKDNEQELRWNQLFSSAFPDLSPLLTQPLKVTLYFPPFFPLNFKERLAGMDLLNTNVYVWFRPTIKQIRLSLLAKLAKSCVKSTVASFLLGTALLNPDCSAPRLRIFCQRFSIPLHISIKTSVTEIP